ncbi:hypothetical protein HOF56_03825 [Candidatus Peribacteria bacterium]|jgi:hypothetical protein|nr:hypothetical protein [Candidatus Peribacteria bacterium]MBT4021214.1 hypothetical protein [Candidatus Peribacteria bacterium]MBT4240710.1 hypothetical protein [Candidatus Peribacteria bacterium]MBT4473963.1 hypothetical protein [Candidatus Peribacteria bacterium]
MAIYAVKNGSESNERLVNRWKQQIQDSRLTKKLRATARFLKRPTKRLTRMSAVKRNEYRSKNSKQKFYSNM